MPEEPQPKGLISARLAAAIVGVLTAIAVLVEALGATNVVP